MYYTQHWESKGPKGFPCTALTGPCVACDLGHKSKKTVGIKLMSDRGLLYSWWAPDDWYLRVRFASEGLSGLVELGDYNEPMES